MRSIATPTGATRASDPMRILLEAIRRGDKAPTVLERRQVVIQLLLEQGIRIHSGDPIFELADSYGSHYRKLANETIASARKEFWKKTMMASYWMVAIGVGAAAWVAGLITGPLLFMKQVDPRYVTVGFVSFIFGGLVVGVALWLISRIGKAEINDVGR